tara:strand:+ start:223 stop:2229 length:2007 start_codon:yes stop_codon:yes gene_type:complete
MKDFYKKESPLQGISGLAGGATGLRMAGVAALPPKYVDEVFSTYLYDGNSTARSITNNIDLTKGGLVWTKRRSGSGNHMWYDTVRGATKYVKSNQSNAANYDSNTLTSFNSDGFSLGTDSSSNDSGTFGSWTFRKREKFFDIVAYTGNNSGQTSQRNINHNLGSTPGMYMIKDLSESSDWKVYHRGMGSAFMNALTLNDTAAMTSAEGWWHYTAPNATRFVVGNADEVNKEGNSFICYLFAHHNGDGVFGPDENKDIIHCDYYTGNGSSTGPEVNIGWEPQWVLIKDSQAVGNWRLYDSMRGIVTVGDDNMLRPDNNQTESTSDRIDLTPTGFKLTNSDTDLNANGNRYIYTAIRRPDGVVAKPASAGTDVFAMDMGSGSSTIPNYDSGFPVDFAIYSQPASTDTRWTTARLIGPNEVKANDNNAEASYAANTWDSNVGWNQNGNSSHQSWMWKRGQGFDVVTFKGNGSARTINHSLGQTPLMYWVKRRDTTADWRVYHFGLNGGTTPQNYNVSLQSTSSESSSSYYWNNTAPTSTVFSIGSNGAVNGSGGDIIAFLFANANDADGNAISKVGYYTGDNTDNGSYHITTGFQPRFILIKSVSHAENWNVLDSNRGMGTGSDEKVLILNTTAAQTTTEAVDISSTGFSLRSAGGDFNANGYEYIYYAHA